PGVKGMGVALLLAFGERVVPDSGVSGVAAPVRRFYGSIRQAVERIVVDLVVRAADLNSVLMFRPASRSATRSPRGSRGAADLVVVDAAAVGALNGIRTVAVVRALVVHLDDVVVNQRAGVVKVAG